MLIGRQAVLTDLVNMEKKYIEKYRSKRRAPMGSPDRSFLID